MCGSLLFWATRNTLSNTRDSESADALLEGNRENSGRQLKPRSWKKIHLLKYSLVS